MTLEDKVHAQRLRLFRRAVELGNVSAACQEAGITRSGTPLRTAAAAKPC